MLIQKKIGHIDSFTVADRSIDQLCLEWYETNKRILRKKTRSGKEISLKFMNENPGLTDGDVLYEDGESIIVVEVLPCHCLVIEPGNMFEMASVCYEIGNKHLPLFFDNDCLLVPFEKPLLVLLSAQGYVIKQEERKLIHPLKTTVAPHGNEGSNTLFSRIMRMTSNE